MKKYTTWILMGLLACAVPAAALAGSIWAKANASGRSIYADDTARRVGDVLTILICERSSVKNDTNRSNEKKNSIDLKISSKNTPDYIKAMDQATGRLLSLDNSDWSASLDNKFDGKASYDRSSTVTDSITVTVQDVLPNGNLVVVGTRVRDITGDKQIVQIGGIVRPSDIAFNNTVSSDRVADFHLVATTKGCENRFTQPGWFAKFLNLVNPF